MSQSTTMPDEIHEAFLDWNYDIHESARRSAKIAWAFAGGSLLLAFGAVLAVILMTPLKTVEAVYVRVDASTGIVDVLHSLDEVNLTPEDAVNKYFVGKYVRARAGYLYGAFKTDSATVLTMSDGPARTEYQHAIDKDNPLSPFNQNGHKGRVDISIKSISMLKDGVASVRFVATTKNSGVMTVNHHIATVVFSYVPHADITFSALLTDPLGFVVTEYRDNEEILR